MKLSSHHSGSIRRTTQRGYGIILVLGFAAVLAVFTAAIGTQASSKLHTVSRKGQIDQAHYGAVTGIQMAFALMKEPPDGQDYDFDGFFGDSWLEKERKIRLFLPNQVEAASRLYHNFYGFDGGVDGPPAEDLDEDGVPDNLPPDGTIVPPDHFYIMSVGETKTGTQSDAVVMGSTLSPDFPLLSHAAFGEVGLNIDGRVDHFDSADLEALSAAGDRPATVPPADAPHNSGNFLAAAHLASNGGDLDQIVIGEHARVNGYLLLGENQNAQTFASSRNLPHGTQLGPLFRANQYQVPANADANSDVYQGPNNGNPPSNGNPTGGASGNGNPSNQPAKGSGIPGSSSGHGKINGYVDLQPYNKRFAVAEVPKDASVLGGNSYTVNSDTLKLPEGLDYYVDGDFFSTSSSGPIEIEDTNLDGDIEAVRILVDGNVHIDGSREINENQMPSKLKFYLVGSTVSTPRTFTLTGQSEAFCLVAGNNITIDITGESHLWGAVYGDVVNLEFKSAIHFDRSLIDPNRVMAQYNFTTQGTAVSRNTGITPTRLAPTATEQPGGGGTANPPPDGNPPMDNPTGGGGGGQINNGLKIY